MVVGAGTGVLQDMEQEGAREEIGSESWDEKLSCAWSCPRSESKGCQVAIFFRMVQKKKEEEKEWERSLQLFTAWTTNFLSYRGNHGTTLLSKN